MGEINYRIIIDEHSQKLVRIPVRFSYSIDTNKVKITSEDGENVKIVGEKKHHEQVQLSFQLAYRFLDYWNHYIRLVDYHSERSGVVKSIRNVDLSKLQDIQARLVVLDPDVLLFLHRASDFINRYSEVAAIIALFALELQVERTYKQLKKIITLRTKE